MKRKLMAVAGLVTCAALVASAQEESRFRAGAHGAYSMGGDIEESNAGYGLQAEYDFTKYVGLELSVSRFADEFSDDGVSVDQDLTTIGLSVVARVPLIQALSGFLLAGADYNITDMDVSLDPAAFGGLAMEGDADIDDEVGFHAGAGLALALPKNWELFAEYRYTVLDLSGDVSVSAQGVTATEEVDEGDYNFGLLKLGANYRF